VSGHPLLPFHTSGIVTFAPPSSVPATVTTSSPPYLFKGARPSITGATPAAVGYGQVLFIETPDGASITKVSFIRFDSVR
jgi:hypothetical protein